MVCAGSFSDVMKKCKPSVAPFITRVLYEWGQIQHRQLFNVIENVRTPNVLLKLTLCRAFTLFKWFARAFDEVRNTFIIQII